MKLIVGDKCMGMLEAVGEVFPDAKYPRCSSRLIVDGDHPNSLAMARILFP